MVNIRSSDPSFDAKGRFLRSVLIVCLISELPACAAPPASLQSTPAANLLAVSPKEVKAQEVMTARTSWRLTSQLAQAQHGDARLVRIEGDWVDATGNSNWRLSFFSATAHQMMVFSEGHLQLSQSFAGSPPPELDIARWFFDSDATLHALSLAGRSVTRPAALTLAADLIWQISDSGDHWQLNAETGAILPKSGKQSAPS
jgi:hypothetical protein